MRRLRSRIATRRRTSSARRLRISFAALAHALHHQALATVRRHRTPALAL